MPIKGTMSLIQRVFILVTALWGCCHPQMIDRDQPILIMKNVYDRQSDIMRMLRGLEMQMNTTREGLEMQMNATREGMEMQLNASTEGLEMQMNATREGMEMQLNASTEGMEMQMSATREGLAERLIGLETALESSQQDTQASTTRLLESIQDVNNNWKNNELPQLKTLIEESASDVEEKVTGVSNEVNGLKDRINLLESTLKSSQERSSSDIKAKITEVTNTIKGLVGRVYCLTEENTVSLTSHCYHFSDYTWTWSDAKSYCRKHGGYLIKINSDNEFNFIKDNTSYDRWIGMNDIDAEGEYKWSVDGSSHDPSSKQNWWGEGEPNNVNNEDCVEFRHSTKKLNDIDCDTKKRPICEFTGIAVD